MYTYIQINTKVKTKQPNIFKYINNRNSKCTNNKNKHIINNNKQQQQQQKIDKKQIGKQNQTQTK